MRSFRCSQCNYDKPSCEFRRDRRNPPVCVRCTKGRPPKPSSGLGTSQKTRGKRAAGTLKKNRQSRSRYRHQRLIRQLQSPINKHSECDLQAMIWSRLREKGWYVNTEVKQTIGSGKHVRFDIVVSDPYGTPVRVVELKRQRVNRKGEKVESQVEEQRCFGVPVDLVRGLKDVRQYIELWPEAGSGEPPTAHYDPFPDLGDDTDSEVDEALDARLAREA